MSTMTLPFTIGRGKRKLKVFKVSSPVKHGDGQSINMTHSKANEVGIAIPEPLSMADESSRKVRLFQEYMLYKAEYKPYV